MNPRCSRCGRISSALQSELFGSVMLCIDCITAQRVDMILHTLPEPADWEYQPLSDWEQNFLISVRQQMRQKGAVSEKQYEILEQLWKKLN